MLIWCRLTFYMRDIRFLYQGWFFKVALSCRRFGIASLMDHHRDLEAKGWSGCTQKRSAQAQTQHPTGACPDEARQSCTGHTSVVPWMRAGIAGVQRRRKRRSRERRGSTKRKASFVRWRGSLLARPWIAYTRCKPCHKELKVLDKVILQAGRIDIKTSKLIMFTFLESCVSEARSLIPQLPFTPYSRVRHVTWR